MASGMAKAAFPAKGFFEAINPLKLCLHDRHQNQLGNALTGLDRKGRRPSIPTRYHQFALIIAVDQSDQITQDNAMFMAKTGPWQNNRSIGRVFDLNGQPGAD
jgi:hypothetical protein